MLQSSTVGTPPAQIDPEFERIDGEALPAAVDAQRDEWWVGASIYQIYPRSFQDSNGDGIGDLRGIAMRLPYVASLGVDAIWISPFFKSPMHDFGYDISDYCDVDSRFGTLADFDALVAEAHRLKLRVLIDLVLSHTAAEHLWFAESRQSRDNAKADWYVWADALPDGSPPNNWLSIFGGSAWQWDTRRRQYYMRTFLSSQPDLNYHCPAVQDAVLDVVRFWLARGVDGFRFDVVNFYFHDAQLRSNPPQPEGRFAAAVPRDNPYALQRHLYDKTQPENLEFLQRLRRLLDSRPGITSIGEIGDDEQYATLARYTTGGRLHMAYTFNLMERDCSARFIHGVLDEFLREAGDAWVCWALNNHDVTRVVTRWQALMGGGAQVAPLLLALLGSLRGSICLYQGEELGLTEAQVPFELLQDPYGKAMWPAFTGRDGCRTPMPWHSQASHGGFSDAPPWLPVSAEHLLAAVDVQLAVPDSVLRRYQGFLRWRQQMPALRTGTMALLRAHDQVVAFERRLDQTRVLCVFNLSNEEARYQIGDDVDVRPIDGHGFLGHWDGFEIVLPPHQAFFGRLVPFDITQFD
ncbi:alpha-glucosidase family protein [Piscinibacter sp.]|uniref:alpha-glucosidase family protein n=1 Tax=Piscinibacter sp. TaxID=1903157 RepID=UPI002BD070EA|nr:alpha-glucosidase family protein [Albitalea sp.]HUG23699.1 alpha-glucosidase family protein [Albitalea sp.]